MKKLLSLLLAVCTTLSLTMTACAAQEGPEAAPLAAASQPLPFTDVPADAWYADEVQYATNTAFLPAPAPPPFPRTTC